MTSVNLSGLIRFNYRLSAEAHDGWIRFLALLPAVSAALGTPLNDDGPGQFVMETLLLLVKGYPNKAQH